MRIHMKTSSTSITNRCISRANLGPMT